MKKYIYSVVPIAFRPAKHILAQPDKEFNDYDEARNSVDQNSSQQFLIVRYEKNGDSYVGGHIVSLQPEKTIK